jgi:predicted deacetylase
MKVVIAIHDVSPCFRKEVEIILKDLEEIKKSFLIIPLKNGVDAIDRDFAQMLAGEELVLHGLTHRTNRNDNPGRILLMSSESCKEFYQLNEADTREKIETGIKLMEDSFNVTPQGFIPPMWHHNKHTMGVLKDLGFNYTESASTFTDIRKGIHTFSIPACFDFGGNRCLNYASVKGWKYVFKHLKQPLLRFSIHPADVKNGFLKDIIEMIRWLQDKNYAFVTYDELIHR